MSFPDIEMTISSPEELATLLRELKRRVAQGTLRQIKPSDASLAVDDLTTVPDEGPWPDYVEAYFENARRKRYKLSIETYHGAGGTWGPV